MTPPPTRAKASSGPVTRSELAVVRARTAAAPEWVTAAGIAEATGVSGRTVRHYLHRLHEAGVVLRDGTRRGTRYRLASPRRARAYVDRVEQLAALLYPQRRHTGHATTSRTQTPAP